MAVDAPARPTSEQGERPGHVGGRRRVDIERLAWIGGLALIALILLVRPAVHQVEATDRTGPFFGDQSAWWAIRPPQMGPHHAWYDSASGTTHIVPGHGHGEAQVVFEIEGNWTATPARLTLRPGPGATGTAVTAYETDPVLYRMPGVYVVADYGPYALALAAAVGVLLATASLRLRPDIPVLPVALAGGTGAWLAWMALHAVPGVALFLAVMPLGVLVLVVSAATAVLQKRRALSRLAWMVAVAALAYQMGFWSHVDVVPLAPDA